MPIAAWQGGKSRAIPSCFGDSILFPDARSPSEFGITREMYASVECLQVNSLYVRKIAHKRVHCRDFLIPGDEGDSPEEGSSDSCATAHVRTKRFGNGDMAVRLLMHLEQRNQDARAGDDGIVQ